MNYIKKTYLILKKTYYVYVFLMLCCLACNRIDKVEKEVYIPKQQWFSADTTSFNFYISDTSSRYLLYFLLWHYHSYHYSNIWIKVHLICPDTTLDLQRNFLLADNFHWLGTIYENIVEEKLSFNNTAISLKKGYYQIQFIQIMRENPLQGIIKTGFAIEKETM